MSNATLSAFTSLRTLLSLALATDGGPRVVAPVRRPLASAHPRHSAPVTDLSAGTEALSSVVAAAAPQVELDASWYAGVVPGAGGIDRSIVRLGWLTPLSMTVIGNGNRLALLRPS